MKLNPCPKCGKAKLSPIKSRTREHYGWILYWVVECKCVRMVMSAKKTEAITNWNKG